MDSSPRVYCTGCRQYYTSSEFPRNRLGVPYKTCLRCKVHPRPLYGSATRLTDLFQAKREARRPALAELDVNAPRQTRGGRPLPIADGDENPRSRKRVRRTNAQIERDRNLVAAIAPAPAPLPPPPPQIIPPGFRSRFRDRPALDLGPMDIQYEFCGALYWRAEIVGGTNMEFELCYKRGNVILELLRPSPDILQVLLVGQDPRARNFY